MGVQNFTDLKSVLNALQRKRNRCGIMTCKNISIGLKKHLDEEGIEIPYPTLVTKSLTDISKS